MLTYYPSKPRREGLQYQGGDVKRNIVLIARTKRIWEKRAKENQTELDCPLLEEPYFFHFSPLSVKTINKPISPITRKTKKTAVSACAGLISEPPFRREGSQPIREPRQKEFLSKKKSPLRPPVWPRASIRGRQKRLLPYPKRTLRDYLFVFRYGAVAL